VGILTRQLTYFLLGGLVATYFITKLKTGKSDGYIFHWFYWLSIPSFQFHGGPAGHIREFIE
jgi:conjugal transfer pilus assembly protein TraL